MKDFKDLLREGRPSQRHPLEGHEYHKKSDAELKHIAKDAHEAAEAMKGHNTQAENKYRDQANDSATVRYFRQKNGMPDWYKKKYGHVKEEIEQIDADVKSLDEAEKYGFFGTKNPEIGTRVTHKHTGATGKIKRVITQGGDTHVQYHAEHDTPLVKKGELVTVHAKHVKAVKKMSEEVEQIDEVSPVYNPVKTKGTWEVTHGGKTKSFKAVDSAEAKHKMGKHLGIDYTKIHSKNVKSVNPTVRQNNEEVEQIDELSNDMLGRYKKAAGAQASAADKAGDIKKGNKRFSGIVKATRKQFANDAKKHMKEDNDDVGEMVKDKLKIIINRAQEMHDGLGDAKDMPEWVKSKITLAQDYISTACDYSCGKEQLGEEVELEEQHAEKGRFKPTVPHNVPNVKPPKPRHSGTAVSVPVQSEAYNTMSPSSYDDHPMVAFRKKENENKKNGVPFDPPYKTVKGSGTTTDKSGAKHSPYSKVRDLARKAMQKQMKPVKEASEVSGKAKIVKDAAKGKKDKFEANPELTDSLVKTASQ